MCNKFIQKKIKLSIYPGYVVHGISKWNSIEKSRNSYTEQANQKYLLVAFILVEATVRFLVPWEIFDSMAS